jgi:hypothetical protein
VLSVAWHSSVGIGTSYRLEGSGDGEISRKRPDRPWDPSGLPYKVYRVFPGGKAAGSVALTSLHSPFIAEVKDRVETYLYSSSGPL